MDDEQLAALGVALKESIDINSADDAAEDQDFRWHLGISIIGKECQRAVWYDYRWFTIRHVPGRIARLFARGHAEEPKIIELLQRNKWTVERYDLATMKQFVYSSINGHYGGSCDGIISRVDNTGDYTEKPMLLEMKTHNTKSFVHTADKGVKEAKWQHYVQMCGYGYAFKLDYGLYFAVNKNDDDIYTEFVKLDHTLAQQMEMRAESIITSPTPPAKISNKATDFRCKMCDHIGVCHQGDKPAEHCRSCQNSQPTNGGEWWCNVYTAVIPREVVRKGCGTHYKRID